MHNPILAKFQDEELRARCHSAVGDPLEEVESEDLIDLMENLWTTRRGTYATLREELVKAGRDPWASRQDLAVAYFRSMTTRDRSDEELELLGAELLDEWIRCRVVELIREHQAKEAEQDARSRDKFGIRMPRR